MDYIATTILRRFDTMQIFLNFFKNLLFLNFLTGRFAAHAEDVVKKFEKQQFLNKGEKYAR